MAQALDISLVKIVVKVGAVSRKRVWPLLGIGHHCHCLQAFLCWWGSMRKLALLVRRTGDDDDACGTSTNVFLLLCENDLDLL